MTTHTTYLLPASDSIGTWQQRLGKEPGLARTGSTKVHSEYYDTFDWRLFHAGLLLEWRADESKSDICLTNTDQRTQALCKPCKEPPAPFATNLPDGKIRTCIEALLDLRALAPVSAIQTQRILFAFIDKEGKTRLRVALEAHERCVQRPGPDDRCMLIRLQPLRGYQKAARAFATRLETNFGLAHAADHPGRWLLGGNRGPGAYSSKIRIKIDPEMRADAAVRLIMAHLLETMESNETGTIDNTDTEFLHDFRVAVRRTRSALTQIKTVFTPGALQRYRQEFAWLGTITSPVRDLDVYLLKFEGYQRQLPHELQPDLAPLREFLEHRYTSCRAELVEHLTSDRYRKLKTRWRRYLTTELPGRPTAPDAGKPILQVAKDRTWRMYKRVYREGMTITPESPAEELHELRKSCKKLRYLMEFFQSLYPKKEIRAAIRELKQLQENIGDFQDLEVQMHTLENFSKEMADEGFSAPRTYLAMGALLNNLAVQMSTTRSQFEARFAAFVEPENRERFRTLFKAKS